MSDRDTLFGWNAVTDWPDHFLISHTGFLWAKVQTDTMEERMSESMMPGYYLPGYGFIYYISPFLEKWPQSILQYTDKTG